MDFQLSEDQRALAEGIRALCDGRFPLETIRRAEGEADVAPAAMWSALGEAGVFSILVPEGQAGLGLGLADAVVVFEELGRALVPGPLVGTALAGPLLAEAAEGAAKVGVTFRPPPGAVVPRLVEHLGALDGLLVLPSPFERGASGDPAAWAVVDDWRRDARRVERALDPLTPLWEVSGEVPGDPPERPIEPPASAEELPLRGALLTASLQVGSAGRCVELATEYAANRRQFGRPIGSFQAVKHLCADMLVRAEVARCAVQAAATLSDQPEAVESEAASSGDRPADLLWRAVAGAKLLADEAAVRNARTAIQVHGGMGYTWEVPVHLHLKRARVLATTFGRPAESAEMVAALV